MGEEDPRDKQGGPNKERKMSENKALPWGTQRKKGKNTTVSKGRETLEW